MLRDILNRLMRPHTGHPASGVRPEQAADRLIADGNRAETEGRLGEACRLYREAVAAAPGYGKAHLNLGIGLEGSGDAEAAMAAFEAALAIDPGDPYANYNLARLLHSRGVPARAERLLRAALEHRPEFPEAQVMLSSVHDSQGNLAAAAAALEEALRQRPGYAGALRNHGIILGKLARWSESETALRRAVAADPADAEALFWLGNALARRDGLDEASSCYRRAIELQPGFAAAWIHLGNLHAAGARPEEAADCFRRALVLDPAIADAHVNLGHVLKDMGQAREALACYRAALRLQPDFAEARWSAAMCSIPVLRDSGDDLRRIRAEARNELDALDRWFDAARAGEGHRAVGVQQPFWLAYQEEDNRELLQRYGQLCARLMASWQQRQGARPGGRRGGAHLQVGIVSRYFRDHSVWSAIVKGWFQQLDSERFKLIAFALGPAGDAETLYAKSRAARFEQGKTDLRQWVETIVDARPDVLIYPEVGMDPVTVKLASLRLAPVQVASWGHPETTGLPTMDYYLSAEDLEPVGAQAHYTERLVALPRLGCFVQPAQVESAALDLGAWGIEARTPLLLCPGAPFKYGPEHDSVFPAIARRLGRCRFVFFTHWARGLSEKLRLRLVAAFSREGLDFEQFAVFIPWQPKPAFYQLLKRADVFLDTIGFSGFNTALQAVECGLPIVTREGRFLRGRLAGGILRRMDLAELVAPSEEVYVALAVRLAQDAEYREHIRGRIAASRQVLFEDLAPIRALEEFLLNATGQTPR